MLLIDYLLFKCVHACFLRLFYAKGYFGRYKQFMYRLIILLMRNNTILYSGKSSLFDDNSINVVRS